MSDTFQGAVVGAIAALVGVWLEGFLQAGRESRGRYTDLRMRVYGQLLGSLKQIEAFVAPAFPPTEAYQVDVARTRAVSTIVTTLDEEIGQAELLGDELVLAELRAIRIHLKELEAMMRRGDAGTTLEFLAWDKHHRPLLIGVPVMQEAAREVTLRGELGLLRRIWLRILRAVRPSLYERLIKIRENPFRTDV
jgi:hypothetical protein